MNTKTFLEGLNQIQKGISVLIDSLNTEEAKSTAPVSSNDIKEIADEPVIKVSKSDEFTKKDLDGMSYNDLKKLAKELGISAVGSRKELVAKILDNEVVAEEEETEVPTKKKTKTVAKTIKKSAPVEEPEEPEELDDEEDVDPVEQQVVEATEDMSDDEIRELLDDCGVSSKGKRQALIAKLVQAVKDGKIDFDDSDDGEDEDDTVEEADEDNTEKDVTEEMTKKRKKAYLTFCEETKESFEEGEITREDIIDFINDFNGTKDKMKKVSDEDLVNQYLELSANLIDDDGNIVEEGAYVINDEPYCCGRPLKYDEDENKFICEVCGEEYEGEE